MLECYKGMAIPTVEQTIQVLNANLDIRPIYIDYDKLLMNIFALSDIIEKKIKEFESLSGQSGCDKNAMYYYLQSAHISQYFTVTDKGEISLSADSLNAAKNSGRLNERDLAVVETYTTVSKSMKARSGLVPFLQNPISADMSCDGHRMLEVRPEWSRQNTGRVAMSKPAIQNMNRELQELITVPRGFKLLHTDSGQVEPRITYSAFVADPQIKALIELYNDAYFGLFHYCTMDQSYVDSGTTNFVKMEITDQMKDGRQKIKRYGNAVMYGSKKEEDNVKIAMIKRIGNHPLRLDLIRHIKAQLTKGNTIFNTYFGTPIDISKSPKLIDIGDYGQDEMVKLAINNPIQGTAADLMRYSVMQANRLIMSQKKSSIVCYVHDAGMFCVAEDEWDNIGKELGDIVSYKVDDWIPVYADYDIYEFKPDGAYAKYKY